MEKTWPDVEKIFKDAGINYKQQQWFYRCEIKGKQFYYSPQTGKWRVKGKRVWKQSNSPQEFLASAFKYSPPQNQSPESDRTNKKNTSQQKQKRKQNTNKDYSSEQQQEPPKRSTVDEIRSEFVDRFVEYLQIQRERKYKIGWIWYKLIEEFIPTPREICWLSVVFNYQPEWAYHRIRLFYVPIAREIILRIIELNRDNWGNDFKKRWGTNRETDNQHRSHQYSNNRQEYSRQQYSHQNNYQTHQTNPYAFFYRIYRTHLEILQVQFPFSKQELKTAYRKKALETHPDSGGTAEAFRAVNTAYEILSQHIRV